MSLICVKMWTNGGKAAMYSALLISILLSVLRVQIYASAKALRLEVETSDPSSASCGNCLQQNETN